MLCPVYGGFVKRFCIAGAIIPEDHYFLSHRLDWEQLRDFIEAKHYFILHAPRQSGKTTAVLEWVKELNREGRYKTFYINVEAAQAARNNVEKGMETLLDCFKGEILLQFGEEDPAVRYLQKEIKERSFSGNALQNFLQFWSQSSDKPLVLFIDEIDALVGDTLISVLRQLRAGYIKRPTAFPQSICLFGVRDIRDYRIWSDKEQATILGGSAFNIKTESITLADFTLEQVRALYFEHTKETGQVFTEETVQYAFEQTRGQPWLVNALAYQACFRDIVDRSKEISVDVMQRARDTLVKRCDTHIDVLLSRLLEPRVRTIVDAIISGTKEAMDFPPDDVQYIRDLGLIAPRGYEIANPIYREVIPRALISSMQDRIPQTMPSYLDAEGFLYMDRLLAAFTQFFREHSGAWLKGFAYYESAPHLLLMAFLQRLINGGGSVTREYALDSEKVDLYITWKTQRFVLELKIFYNQKTIEQGLAQLESYMDKTSAEGHLVLFDRDIAKSWEDKIYHRIEQVNGKSVHIWGL
ncbi:MAG: AAA family ATPase [Chlamydiae bacterium]|nr:AAA family ATPase [Chlamydiota bacterium]